METFENEIIFSQKFPDAQPAAMLKKAEELSQAVPAEKRPPIPPFEDMLRRIEKKYTYKPRPDAEKKSEQFIAHAIAVCRDFEIDTEICGRSHEIVVTMDLYCGWHDSAIKRAFAALLNLADDFTLSRDNSKPEYVRISMAYYTHDTYSNGRKMEWF